MFVAIAWVAITVSVVAAKDFTPTSSTVIGTVVFVPSTNVTVNAQATDSTDATYPNRYCVTSFHGAAVNQHFGKQYGALGAINLVTPIVWTTLTGVTSPPRCTRVDALPTGSWQQ